MKHTLFNIRKELARRTVGVVSLPLLIAVALVSQWPLAAQQDVSGKILGTVTDPSGAAVPGARIAVQNQGTNLVVRTTSDERGNYLFASLPAGTYSIKCESTGFQTFTASGIFLQSQMAVTVPLPLRVGVSTQSVEVSAAANMVDMDANSTIQTTFSQTLIEALPVWGRDPRQTMELLAPGAEDAGNAPSYNVPTISFNGVAGTSNNYRIDGSDVNDYFHGSASGYPASENLAEFSITTNLPDASMARGGGGQIQAVLKSGTNNLHGQGWVYLQNGGWNANSWQNNWAGLPRQQLEQRWYGANAGGPVVLPHIYNGKDRTFFFLSYERTSTTKTATFTGQTITDAERSGDFSNSRGGIPVIDGVRTPIIPKSRFSRMGNYLTSGTNILPRPSAGTDIYSWQPYMTETVQPFIGKIDEYISPQHRLFGSLWWSRDDAISNSLSLLSFGGSASYYSYPNPKLTWSENKRLQSWTINDTYTISATMMNNFILGVKRLAIPVLNNYSPANALFTAADVGAGSVGDVKAPDVQRISVPRLMPYGIYNGYIDDMKQNSVYVTDNFVYVRGRHTWKMGVEIRQYHELKYQTWGAGGNYSFGDGRQTYGGTGNGVADMMIGAGASFSQNNTQILDIHYPAREAYVQDTFKVSRRWTFMFGARWQPHFGVVPTTRNFVTFREGQQSAMFPKAPLGLLTVGDAGIPPNLYGTRWGNLGPRATFAWDIFGKGRAALRGGYAWTTDYQYLVPFNSYTNMPPYGVKYSAPAGTANVLAQPYQYSYGSKVPFPFTPPVPGAAGNATLVFATPVNIQGMDANYNSGQIHQWNVAFDFEPVKAYVVSVGYVATRGTHLSESHNLNWPRFVVGASANTTASQQSRQPYFPLGFGTITMYAADWNSNYQSLQVRFSKRLSYGLTFTGSYTLSSTTKQNGCRYWEDCSIDYHSPGLASRFTTAFSYDVPFRSASKVSKALLGGWTLGGTLTGNSGSYGSVGDYNCSQFNYGSASCYATYVGSSPYSPDRGKPAMQGAQVGITWLDRRSFVRVNESLVNGVIASSPDVGRRVFLGNAVPGIFKGPAAFLANASLQKKFKILEHLSLGYRLEAFNALNHTALLAPSGTVQPDMSRFGVITRAMNPRTVQMSAKVIF